MARKVAALLAVALLSAAACGDSSDDQDPPPRGDEDAAPAAMTVRASDFEFDPTALEVDVGESGEITFVNAGNVAHTFTAEEIAVDVEAKSGEEVKASFTAPDEDTTIQFVCKFHPSMKGEITVGDGGSGAGGGGGSGEDSDSFDY